MKYDARLASSICLVTSVMFCLSILSYATTRFVTPAHAERESITGSISSSPSSGPVGTTISVSGSGWPEPDGEQVSLGYMIESFCSIVPDAQANPFKNGSFSGWLHLPNGSPPGIYSICATFGNTTAEANIFTVLTESTPQIHISLTTQSGEQQATISGSNFVPAGTTVNLFWESTNGSVIFTITPAVSNSNGLISRTFTVPTTITSDPYKIVANVGGQQPSLSTSVTFTYTALAPTPTPKPTPIPTSDPTPAKHLSPTAVASSVVTPVSTPTIGATEPAGSQNTGQTPTAGTSSFDFHTLLSRRNVLIGSIIGVLALFSTILIIAFFIRRNTDRSTPTPLVAAPTQSSAMSWSNNQVGGTPYPLNNGPMAVSPPWPGVATPPSPQQLQISPYTHLLQQGGEGNSGFTGEPPKLTPNDPNLESIKRQVQMGLFATPGKRQG